MTPEQFQDALDRHGAVLAEWPASEAQAATELLLVSPAARTALARAERLDAELSDLLATPRPAPASLKASIFDALPPQQSAQILDFPMAVAPAPADLRPSNDWRKLTATAAAVLIVCFVGGICARSVFTAKDDAESIYVSAVYGDLAF